MISVSIAVEALPAATKRRQKPLAVSQMNMRKLASIGIDVGGTKTRMALLGDKFEVIEDIKFRTPTTEKEFATELTRSVGKLVNMAAFGRLTITAVGIGVAGSVDGHKEAITFAPNVPFL